MNKVKATFKIEITDNRITIGFNDYTGKGKSENFTWLRDEQTKYIIPFIYSEFLRLKGGISFLLDLMGGKK